MAEFRGVRQEDGDDDGPERSGARPQGPHGSEKHGGPDGQQKREKNHEIATIAGSVFCLTADSHEEKQFRPQTPDPPVASAPGFFGLFIVQALW